MYLVCPSWLLDYITAAVCAHQAGSQLLVDGVYEHIAPSPLRKVHAVSALVGGQHLSLLDLHRTARPGSPHDTPRTRCNTGDSLPI